MDLRRWPDFDSSIVGVDGIASRGGRVTIHTRFGQELPFKVVDVAPGQLLVLRGGAYMGLLKYERRYEVVSDADGECTLTVEAVFSGPAMPFVSANIPNFTPSFLRFVDNIRAHAEHEEQVVRNIRHTERVG